MRITSVTLHPYRVAFRMPFATSHGPEHFRRGLIIWISTDSGLNGLGEAASLPAFGTGSHEFIEKRTRQIVPLLKGKTLEEALVAADAIADEPLCAPIGFALDTALLDVAAQQAGLSLARFLDPCAASEVPVNATISDVNAETAARSASRAAAEGFPAIKLKVGVLRDSGAEFERIAAVREAIGPNIELRLDANGAWNYDQAVTFLERLHKYDISYLEQPVSASDLRGMARLRGSGMVPVAADESATSAEAVKEIIRLDAADVIVLKPGIVGGLRRSRELIELSHWSGMGVVVTTSLETGAGIAAALHLAATLPEPIPACGLATGGLLEDDLLDESPQIFNGKMVVPSEPGLGVELARKCLTRHLR